MTMPSPQGQSPKIDLAQAERFLTLLDETAEGFVFQTFDDLKSRKDKRLAAIKIGDLSDWAPFLSDMNRRGAGIFVTVNASDGKGRRIENIERIRAIWHEEDTACGKQFPLEPHILVESSPGKYHRYWLVDGLSHDEFAGIMARMVHDYGSDPNARDLARVLRVPGFLHQKDPAHPFQVRIVATSGDQAYSAETLKKAFPPLLNTPSESPPKPAAGLADGSAKSLAAELASRAARRTHEDPTKGRHSQILWLGRECAYRGVPVDYADYALTVFSRLMRPADAAGRPTAMHFESEKKAFLDAYRKGLQNPKPPAGRYVLTGHPEGTLVVCLDAATGASIHAATAWAVAVVESAENWVPAAKVLRKEFPAIRLVFADIYQAKEEVIRGSRCEAAAETVGGVVIAPSFSQTELSANPRTFADLHRLRGVEAVRNAIHDALGNLVLLGAARTRKELESLIDDTDDFDVLTGALVAQVVSSGMSGAAREMLLGKIAKKAGVPKGSLIESGKGGDPPDQPSDEDDQIKGLNEKHAVLPIGGRVLILNREYDPVQHKSLFTFSAKTDFETRYCNRRVFDRGEEVGLGTYWLNHPQRAEYEGMVFSPGREVPKYLNLWSGWGVEPREGDCFEILNFIDEVICSGDDSLCEYIIRWFAHMVQRPLELPETALVFRGREGIGKNTLVDPFRDIVGREHFLLLSSLNQVTGRFSGHLANALLVFCNESVWGGDKSAQGVLKSMITDEYQPIEHKGRDLMMVKNYRRMVFATNENWAVPRGADDRRYVITDVSDARKGDYAYFARVKEQMANGGTAALMHFLLSYDITGWHPRMIPNHLSERGWELKIRSGGSIVQWWFDMIQQGWLEKVEAHYADEDKYHWPDRCPTDVVQRSYLRWCTDHKVTHPEHSVAIGRSLHDWGVRTSRPRVDNPSRKLYYLLPSLEESRELFSRRFSIPPKLWGYHDAGMIYE
jgi:hypothetical protein